MEEKKHMIQVKNTLYNDIKEYCDLNNLKVNIFINELIEKSFLIEKYGSSPFNNFREKINDTVEIPEPIQEVIDNHFWEMLDEEKPQEEVIPVPEELKKNFEENITKTIIQPKIENKPKRRRLK